MGRALEGRKRRQGSRGKCESRPASKPMVRYLALRSLSRSSFAARRSFDSPTAYTVRAVNTTRSRSASDIDAPRSRGKP
jgi:hypothetical protein